MKKYALVSENAPEKLTEIIGNLGYGCVLLPEFEYLQKPVASHADMLFFVINDKKILCDERYFSENKDLFSFCGEMQIVPSKVKLSERYPDDIWFDCLVYQGKLYGKKDRIAPEILDFYGKAEFIRQGYAGCSVLCTDRLAITSDKGIYKAITANGDKAVLVPPQKILLNGYDRGFIGGASGFDRCGNNVVLTGDPESIESGAKIVKLLESVGHKVVYPKDLPITDIGGIKFLS